MTEGVDARLARIEEQAKSRDSVIERIERAVERTETSVAAIENKFQEIEGGKKVLWMIAAALAAVGGYIVKALEIFGGVPHR